ncbi:MAG: 2-C-methyl-D-erythritol 2,4-cyclodiphosphate synthase [Mycoplasma sp.]|nr:2-C-methyl-D-erythritol 2,4-cyclodiphosphate synthase [Mycoplasma sp.]
MNTNSKFLIGEGFDIHKLVKVKNNFMILADTKIKSDYKIKAHSDGDLVMHAIANSVLGAVVKGDIGIYFPDNNNKCNNIDSSLILLFAISQLPKGYKINNIDLTVICDKVKLSNYRKQMTDNLINLTKCKNINVKFTRFEQDKMLIACRCVTSIIKE